MEIIWILVLSVCGTDRCISQTVLETDTKFKCQTELVLHEQMPQDGPWRSVEYNCLLLNALEV